jgi:hypothetical protein
MERSLTPTASMIFCHFYGSNPSGETGKNQRMKALVFDL